MLFSMFCLCDYIHVYCICNTLLKLENPSVQPCPLRYLCHKLVRGHPSFISMYTLCTVLIKFKSLDILYPLVIKYLRSLITSAGGDISE